MRLSGVASTISAAPPCDREPRIAGSAAATSRHRRHDAAERISVHLEPPPQVRPPGVVEQRERQVRLEHRVADLGGVELHVHREGPFLGRLVRPLRALARLLEAADGGQRLRAGDQCEVEAALPYLPRRLDRQHLGHRPADARVAAPRRRRAHAFGQSLHGVVVLPRLRVHDVDALEPAQHTRPWHRHRAVAPSTASAAASLVTRSHMSSGSGARPPAATTSSSVGCQVWRATPMMQAARGSAPHS